MTPRIVGYTVRQLEYCRECFEKDVFDHVLDDDFGSTVFETCEGDGNGERCARCDRSIDPQPEE